MNADHNIFIAKHGLEKSVVSTFVDDIKIIDLRNSAVIAKVRIELTAAFEIVDIELISFYIGLKVEKNREKKRIKFSQPTYIQKILTKYHFDKANIINILIKKVIPGANLSFEATKR